MPSPAHAHAASTRYALAVDLGGTKVESVLVDGTGTLLPGSRHRSPTGRAAGSDRLEASVWDVVTRTRAGRPARVRVTTSRTLASSRSEPAARPVGERCRLPGSRVPVPSTSTDSTLVPPRSTASAYLVDAACAWAGLGMV